MILDSSCLIYVAWPRASSGSAGLYLISPLSDMSPATSDCLEPYFSVFFSSNYRVCVDFSGSTHLSICTILGSS